MLTENYSSPPRKSIRTSPLALVPFLVLAAAIYVGWVFFSRHREDVAYNQRIRNQQLQKQRASDQAAIQQLGGSELAIQTLYAPPQIRRGETAQICYGVANAKSVTLKPQSNPVWPSQSRCVDVTPTKTTTYTLTATAVDGKSVSQQITIAVH